MASRRCWVLYCELVTFGFEMQWQDLVSLRPFFFQIIVNCIYCVCLFMSHGTLVVVLGNLWELVSLLIFKVRLSLLVLVTLPRSHLSHLSVY